jgi:hypothetical protein
MPILSLPLLCVSGDAGSRLKNQATYLDEELGHLTAPTFAASRRRWDRIGPSPSGLDGTKGEAIQCLGTTTPIGRYLVQQRRRVSYPENSVGVQFEVASSMMHG